jgi:hypothetical protein
MGEYTTDARGDPVWLFTTMAGGNTYNPYSYSHMQETGEITVYSSNRHGWFQGQLIQNGQRMVR